MREKLKPGEELIDSSGVHITNRTTKSKVVAEFVDAIPAPVDTLSPHRAPTFVPQDGLREGFQKAMQAPGRALLLLHYDKEAGSVATRKKMALWRAKRLQEQGYRESMGWTVRAVDDKVYVMYDPRTMEY